MNNIRLIIKLSIYSYLILIFFIPVSSYLAITQDQLNSFTRRVNVPYLGTYPPDPEVFTPTIFWFGEVTPTSNSADVRVYYYDSHLSVVFHIIDRRLWFDPDKSESDLTQWDGVSLYLNMNGNTGGTPGTNSYLIQSQLNFQSAYRGNGTTWENAPISYTTETGWRGNYPNNNIDDKGWSVKFEIPFSSLGLSGPPPQGTIWGLAAKVHDRDDESSTPIPDQFWPEAMEPDVPSTWGQMRFGVPGYNHPPSLTDRVITIRDGLNGVSVKDGHVGGHTTCGADVDHWSEWGDANYAGYNQINIQNQWDVADYPCFSKYYVTFPLDSLPPYSSDKVMSSATLTMTLFGNAGGGKWGEPPDSYIQVLTVDEDWDEATLNWNNAPLALENISGTWVRPRDYSLPDQSYQWDVSRAFADAYAHGEPLRLALYSADGELHTGKYFWSSDVGDWNAAARPTLQVVLGNPCDAPEIDCSFLYLPMANKSINN